MIEWESDCCFFFGTADKYVEAIVIDCMFVYELTVCTGEVQNIVLL
jgi:hypothetical protein